MSNDKGLKIIAWGFFLLVLAMGGYYVMEQSRLIKGLQVKFNKARITYLSLQKMVIDIYLDFINPSNIDLNIDDFKFGVYVNGKYISDIISAKPEYIAANGTSTIVTEVVFNPLTVLASLFSKAVLVPLLTDYKAVTIRMKGTITGDHRNIGMKNIEIDISDSLYNLLIKDKDEDKTA